MKIIQSTIERLLYILIALLLLISIATFVKLTNDDAKKFKVLKQNQQQLICIVTKFADFRTTQPAVLKASIDKCIGGEE